jgi:hypothetical protein
MTLPVLLALSLLTADPRWGPPRQRHPWELTVLGGIAAGGGWIASIATYFGSIQCQKELGVIPTNCSSASGSLMIPIAGPWVALADPVTQQRGMVGGVIALGIVQAVGLLLVILGPLLKVDD